MADGRPRVPLAHLLPSILTRMVQSRLQHFVRPPGRFGELPPPPRCPQGQLHPPSPGCCTSDDFWGLGGHGGLGDRPVDQVGLGTNPGRHQLLVLSPHWLDVKPVRTDKDVTLLEKRAAWRTAHRPHCTTEPLWDVTALGTDLP